MPQITLLLTMWRIYCKGLQLMLVQLDMIMTTALAELTQVLHCRAFAGQDLK